MKQAITNHAMKRLCRSCPFELRVLVCYLGTTMAAGIRLPVQSLRNRKRNLFHRSERGIPDSHSRWTAILSLVLAGSIPVLAIAQESAQDLAKKLANPVASLISLPFQLNYDQSIGPVDDGQRWTLNIQPVVPFDLNKDWNLISRTILPVIAQQDIAPGSGSQSGIGDIVQSLFFSPKALTAGGWIWGAGPVFLLPTGSDTLLTSDKWGIGPTGVILKQDSGWTYGILANHIWSFAGKDSRPDINATFLQPFLSYTTPSAWTFGVSTESTYDWKNKQWTVPISVSVSKVTKIGDQLTSISGGVRYWADGPVNAPEGFGFRLTFTLLYPK